MSVVASALHSQQWHRCRWTMEATQMRFNILGLTAALACAAFTSVSAQQRSRSAADSIPAAYRPPAGMCRVWIDGVPSDKQSAPTDCATAARNRPSNGRVIYGDNGQSGRPKWRGGDSARSGGVKCVDRDHDGKCDADSTGAARNPGSSFADGPFRAGSAAGNSCLDRDKNGRCDETWAKGTPPLPALRPTQSQSAARDPRVRPDTLR